VSEVYGRTLRNYLDDRRRGFLESLIRGLFSDHFGLVGCARHVGVVIEPVSFTCPFPVSVVVD
jgi:hypothetical protein